MFLNSQAFTFPRGILSRAIPATGRPVQPRPAAVLSRQELRRLVCDMVD